METLIERLCRELALKERVVASIDRGAITESVGVNSHLRPDDMTIEPARHIAKAADLQKRLARAKAEAV